MSLHERVKRHSQKKISKVYLVSLQINGLSCHHWTTFVQYVIGKSFESYLSFKV